MANNIAAQGMVRDLVGQFSDPYAFYRELIQNAIDAGSNRVDVTVEFVPGPPGTPGLAIAAVEDDGAGMDEQIIDNYLLVLFRSTKEDDLTKIGKFGVGFLSVFALKPDLVRVSTARNMESWRLDFPDWRS
jgi:HSP90 family molecular chaperone